MFCLISSPLSSKLEERKDGWERGCWQSWTKTRLFALDRSIKINPH